MLIVTPGVSVCCQLACVCVARAEYAGQVHRMVPQRDHATGPVATALPARRLHALQGVYHSYVPPAPLRPAALPLYHFGCPHIAGIDIQTLYFFHHICQ